MAGRRPAPPSFTNGNRLWIVALLFFPLLIWGLAELLRAPVAAGDVYPPYSSLRSDPLGAKALFESLSELPQLTVTRLYKSRTPLTLGATLLVLGENSAAMAVAPKIALDEYGKLLEHGGRIVIAFL